MLTDAIERVTAGLDALLAVPPASVSDEDVARLLDFATSCVDRAAGAVTAAVGEADHRRLGDAIGARHTGQWWAQRSLLTRPEANRLTRLGRRLSDELYAPVHAALAGGGLHADQAAVGEAAEAKALADEDAAAEMLRKQLLAIAAPKHPTATGNPDPDPSPAPGADERPLHARLGWAFIEWIERYPADHLPRPAAPPRPW